MASDHTLFLSPHFDDVVLSCGGTISRQIRRGENVEALTIFGGQPPGSGTSCLINSFHDVMGNPARLVDRRRSEDALAYGQLGCAYEYLDFPDAIYRGRLQEGVFYYDTMGALFGEVHPDEADLPLAVADSIRAHLNPGTTIVAPLGLGGHVDHQIVHEAAQRHLTADAHVVYYEEFPYGDPEYPGLKGLDTAGVHRPLNEVTGSASFSSILSEFKTEDLDRKVSAIGKYRSQLQLIFGQDPLWPVRILDFARRFGRSIIAERFWQPAG